MTIIEQQTTGKRSEAECEDGVAATADFVAVIDGSTSKSPYRIDPQMANGRLCMLTVANYIRHMAAGMSAREFCQGVTSAIRNIYLAHGVDMRRLAENPAERMTASAVVYSRLRRQVWMIGDCQCIVGGIRHDNPKPYEREIASRRAEHIHLALANGACADDFRHDDEGRAAILPQLVAACKGQNKAFAVIDGFPIPFEYVKIIDANSGDGDIILASDGYPFLYPTLRESEDALARQLAADPLCIGTFKATKGLMHDNRSFDDRCYVRFR